MDADRRPVIVGVGEIRDRPAEVAQAREPVALMQDALLAAEQDAAAPLIARIDSIDLVGQITWRYADPVGTLCQRLAIAPARRVNVSMGGETPVRLLQEAADRIACGESQVAAIVGGEAVHARQTAKREGVTLPWSPPAPPEAIPQLAGSRLELSQLTRLVGAKAPVQIYPLYENAVQAALGQSPVDALQENASLWAAYARVAADNPFAWNRTGPDAAAIARIDERNRMIAWPYPKFMVANPAVNLAAGAIVTSEACALAAGISPERLVHVHHGAFAAEPDDILERVSLSVSIAMEECLAQALADTPGGIDGIDLWELYSCFPIVPKLALAALGRPVAPTVTGGLSFFGGPLNNYMSHALCAMVRALRRGEGRVGLLYGQGGVLSKHHAIVLGTEPVRYKPGKGNVQARVDARRQGAVPAVAQSPEGPAVIETHTVEFDREGMASGGIVVLRLADGRRSLATVPASDRATLDFLTSPEHSPVGQWGTVWQEAGMPIWSWRKS